MDDPDVVIRRDIEADGLADYPMIWKWLRPKGVNFKVRRGHTGGLHFGFLAEHCGSDSESGGECDDRGTHIQITLHLLKNLPTDFQNNLAFSDNLEPSLRERTFAKKTTAQNDTPAFGTSTTIHDVYGIVNWLNAISLAAAARVR